MKQTIFSILIISLLILSACGTDNLQAVDEPTKASPNADESSQKYVKIQAAKEAVKETGCKGAENVEKLKSTMENPDEIIKMAMAVNSYLDVKPGECVIFPVAVRNEFLDNKEMWLEVYFKKATDRAPIANILSADNDLMKTWIEMPAAKTITPHEYSIFFVKITVNDMRTAEDKTSSGTYRFGVQAYYKTGTSSQMKYEPEKEIFVRVLE